MVGIDRIGAGRRLLVVGLAHVDAGRQAVLLRALRGGDQWLEQCKRKNERAECTRHRLLLIFDG